VEVRPLSKSLVYQNALLYELVMIALYGRHYWARYRSVAGLIQRGWSVVELCCGPGVLFDRYLRGMGVSYTGIDVNPSFVARVNRRGGRGLVRDLHEDRPLPEADAVVMQASLYQFLPDDASHVVRRMLASARRRVVIAEPIRNLSDARVPVLSALARRQTDPGLGARPLRFTGATLDAFFADIGLRPTRSFLTPGVRERVVVFDLEPQAERGGP
jgi:Methionine biosynthesis protein MetW